MPKPITLLAQFYRTERIDTFGQFHSSGAFFPAYDQRRRRKDEDEEEEERVFH